MTIHGPVDRIYDSAEPIAVTDPGHQRTIGIDKRNAPSTIVWNPWSTHSAPLPDMADDEFPTMVCVESGAVREHAPTIEPGGELVHAGDLERREHRSVMGSTCMWLGGLGSRHAKFLCVAGARLR